MLGNLGNLSVQEILKEFLLGADGSVLEFLFYFLFCVLSLEFFLCLCVWR